MPTKLGQNFLRDENVVKKIITSANLKPDDFVIEVGPGEGILTKHLAKYAKKVLAIEIDESLVKNLHTQFKNQSNVEIIKADILKLNLQELSESYDLQNKKYKVIANLPYYITSPIIRIFLETALSPQEMILMVQKEVAKRIVAKPGKMSILAVSVQYYAHPELIFEVKKESFEPIPKVDSTVIKITQLEARSAKPETKAFFRLVRAGFSAKRKTLVNNLSNGLHLDKKLIEKKLDQIKLDSTVRAQELSVEKWRELLKIL